MVRDELIAARIDTGLSAATSLRLSSSSAISRAGTGRFDRINGRFWYLEEALIGGSDLPVGDLTSLPSSGLKRRRETVPYQDHRLDCAPRSSFIPGNRLAPGDAGSR